MPAKQSKGGKFGRHKRKPGNVRYNNEDRASVNKKKRIAKEARRQERLKARNEKSAN